MDQQKTEDRVLKKILELFADGGLAFLGIKGKIKAWGSTEVIELSISSMYLDFTFLMEDDYYIHFEFQSTDGGNEDLNRFRFYEVNYSYHTGKPVITYVIYTNGITKTKDTYVSGINTYRIIPIYMASYNGDDLLEGIRKKLAEGVKLTKEDMLAASFVPLMGGKLSRYERIREVLIAAREMEAQYSQEVQAMMYAFAVRSNASVLAASC